MARLRIDDEFGTSVMVENVNTMCGMGTVCNLHFWKRHPINVAEMGKMYGNLYDELMQGECADLSYRKSLWIFTDAENGERSHGYNAPPNDMIPCMWGFNKWVEENHPESIDGLSHHYFNSNSGHNIGLFVLTTRFAYRSERNEKQVLHNKGEE